MSEMIERVADAIRTYEDEHGEYTAADLARVAIAAMREPTPEMLGAVYGSHGETSGTISPQAAADWRTMIDEALSQDGRFELGCT